MRAQWLVRFDRNVPEGMNALNTSYMLEIHEVHFDSVASSYTLHSFGWVSIRLQVHTLSRRPPVAPTNCPIHSSAGDGRRPWLVISALLRNFPTANACWQPASHALQLGQTTQAPAEPGGGAPHSRTNILLAIRRAHSKWRAGLRCDSVNCPVAQSRWLATQAPSPASLGWP